jgi:hypothetical protein
MNMPRPDTAVGGVWRRWRWKTWVIATTATSTCPCPRVRGLRSPATPRRRSAWR